MLGASGSNEGRDSWQRAQAGVSLAPPGCLRGPGAASPVTGPQLQVEQSRGEEKAGWGKAACSLRRRQTGVSARPHAAPRPAMGPLWLQLTVCPKPGLTARSVLRRVRQRLHPVKSFVRITIRSAGPGSHAHPDGQQVPPRLAAPGTACGLLRQPLGPKGWSSSFWSRAGRWLNTITTSLPRGERVCSVTDRAWYSAPRQGNQNPGKN